MSTNRSQSNCSIVSLGEVLWDLFPDGNRFGGASANFACHAAAESQLFPAASVKRERK